MANFVAVMYSQPQPIPALILLAGLVGIAMGLFIGTVFLRAATKWAVGYELPFWEATWIYIQVGVVSVCVTVPLNLIWATDYEDSIGTSQIICRAAAGTICFFPIGAFMLGRLIGTHEAGRIGFVKGLLVQLYLTLLAWTLMGAVIEGAYFAGLFDP